MDLLVVKRQESSPQIVKPSRRVWIPCFKSSIKDGTIKGVPGQSDPQESSYVSRFRSENFCLVFFQFGYDFERVKLTARGLVKQNH